VGEGRGKSRTCSWTYDIICAWPCFVQICMCTRKAYIFIRMRSPLKLSPIHVHTRTHLSLPSVPLFSRTWWLGGSNGCSAWHRRLGGGGASMLCLESSGTCVM